MNIELYPLEKAVINGVDIPLGMNRAAVEKLLGRGETSDRSAYYFQSNLRIDYDAKGCVEFIEALGGDIALIYGISAFDAEPYMLRKILSEKNSGEIDDSEHGYSYAFLEISVGIYRAMTPKDCAELLSEAQAGEDKYAPAGSWASIGIGIRDYYRQ